MLRYHAVPYLKADPPVAIERVFLEGDPVPFIGLRPTAGAGDDRDGPARPGAMAVP